jgi:RNA recognition motif-containing protein
MKIYVTNVGAQVTEDSLAAVFRTFGRVNQSRIIVDPNTGVANGALIEMPDDAEGSLAIAKLNGSFINGRVIRAHHAPIAV